MTHTQKTFQKKLQIEKQVLLVQLRKASVQNNSEPADIVELQLQNKMQTKLESVDRALGRLDNGGFGICQVCRKQIDAERLEVLPSAELCIDCQRRLERKTFHQYAYAYSTH